VLRNGVLGDRAPKLQARRIRKYGKALDFNPWGSVSAPASARSALAPSGATARTLALAGKAVSADVAKSGFHGVGLAACAPLLATRALPARVAPG